MQQRMFGKTGRLVGEIGLGTWQLGRCKLVRPLGVFHQNQRSKPILDDQPRLCGKFFSYGTLVLFLVIHDNLTLKQKTDWATLFRLPSLSSFWPILQRILLTG